MENKKHKTKSNEAEMNAEDNIDVTSDTEETVSADQNNPENENDSKVGNQKINFVFQKEILQLKKELEEQKEKYIRLFAEFDNYRKRTQKEKTDAYTDGNTTAILSFLPLIDNMERALSYTPDDEGMKALTKQLEDILKSLGVTAIESDNKPFDPNFHNAIMHEEDESINECKVVETFQKGYMLGDKVIRHSMVKVVN